MIPFVCFAFVLFKLRAYSNSNFFLLLTTDGATSIRVAMRGTTMGRHLLFASAAMCHIDNF